MERFLFFFLELTRLSSFSEIKMLAYNFFQFMYNVYKLSTSKSLIINEKNYMNFNPYHET